jgi:hypothetical protein
MEGAADAEIAFDPESAAHQFDELRRDGEAQTGAAIQPCGRAIGLGESFENVIAPAAANRAKPSGR